MNILILSNSDSGLYSFRKEVIEALSKKHTVTCSVPNEDGYIDKLEGLGCRCIPTEFNRRGKNPIGDLILLYKYHRFIKKVRPGVVLSYTIKPNVYGGIACQLHKIPYLSNVTGLGTTIENGGIISKISLILYRIGLRGATCVFFQNKQNMELFKSKKIVRGPVRLIPGSGVNVEVHRYEEYPEDESCFRFIFVGRVMKDKGIEELLTAIGRLADEGKEVFLDIVGSCDEDYTQLISTYEAREIVKYHGSQRNVHQFYTNCHCVVLPSYHEGMANVMLEAASTGRPVITTRIPGCQETFDEGITGYGCSVKDADSLKNAMERMYDTPWSKRREMGIAGRKKVSTEFDRQKIIDAYIEQIDHVGKRSNKHRAQRNRKGTASINRSNRC